LVLGGDKKILDFYLGCGIINLPTKTLYVTRSSQYSKIGCFFFTVQAKIFINLLKKCLDKLKKIWYTLGANGKSDILTN